jgi:CBS domain containing-hemolysin-like protein
MMSSIDIRAIVLATLAVFGIDFVTGIVLFNMFSGNQVANASDEQMRAAAEALAHDADYLRAALILGTASTVVGGFLVARIARRIPYFNALAYGVLGMALSTLTTGTLPVWFRVVGIGLTVPAALFGAYFGRRPLSK